MNSTLKKIIVSIALVAVVVFAYFIFGGNSQKFGSTAIPDQQNAESATIAGFFSESIATAGTFFLGGHNSDTYTIAQYAQGGVCTDATTTIFSLKNPFSATSSARLVALTGYTGTSTIKLLTGTSTVAVATPSIVGILSNISTTTANSSFYTSSDSIYGPAGYLNSNATSSQMIVGPNEYLLGFATSSTGLAVDTASITQTGNLFNCSYKVLWTK